MSKKTYAQLKGLAQKQIPEANPDIMAAIAMAESSGDTDAISSTGDYGLWQINKKTWEKTDNLFGTASGRMFFALGRWKNEIYNAKAARTVFKKQGYSAWVTYNNGSYKRFIREDVPGDGGGIIGAPDSDIGNSVTGVGSAIGSALITVREYSTVGAIAVGGFVLVILALVILLRKPAAQVASNALPVTKIAKKLS